MPDLNDAPDLDATVPVAGPTPSAGSTPRLTVNLPLPEDLAKLLPEGTYTVQSFLGQGGMGAVYRGTQVRLQRQVAIKIMCRDQGKDHGFEERFRREALALAQLNHPNIVNVIDYGEAGPDYLYIVMEFVDGTDLVGVIRSGQMTQETALKLLPQICDALQFAHDNGIVHRDIKPANILLTRDGRIKMADFGLAKRFDVNSTFHTQTGAGMGTPDYAAPEQFDPHGNVDHRADIYALGVMIYQMVTGQLPRGAWKPPSEKADVDAHWDKIVSHALQTDPSDRYASVSEIKSDLGGITTVSSGPRLAPDGPQSAQTAGMTAAKGSTTALTQAGGRPASKVLPLAAQSVAQQKKSSRAPLIIAASLIVLAAGAWFGWKNSKTAPTKATANPASNVPLSFSASSRTWSPPTPTVTVGTEWMNLIPHIQPVRDVIRGEWAVDGKGLHAKRMPWALCNLPVQDPGTDYDLRYKVTRGEGSHLAMFCLFRKGDTGGMVPVDYVDGGKVELGNGMRVVGLESVQNTMFRPSSGWKKEWLPRGKACTVVLQVREKEVRLTVDDVEALRWQADWSQIRQRPSEDHPMFKGTSGSSIFGVGIYDCEATFHSIEMRRVGDARPDASLQPSASTPANATKDTPFVNTLGMKFVPVPGTNVLFCTHETRVHDYTAFDAEEPDTEGMWRLQHHEGVPVGREPDHPVVGVTWEDARRFCDWLGKKEGRTYRLPTDREWSFAAGIAAQEPWTAESLPEQINMKGPDRFEWGAQLPPPAGSGNFADMSCKQQFPRISCIEGYEDGFPTTAPVGRFKPNQIGLYDMLGNAAEWCEDWFEKDHVTKVLRGQCWRAYHRTDLLLTARMKISPKSRTGAAGFRCVLIPDEGK